MYKFKIWKFKKAKTKVRAKNKRKASRVSIKVIRIDKETIKLLLKTIVMSQAQKIVTPIGFVFDMDSIVISSGQLVGAQSTVLQVKGATVVFYIENLLNQFEIDQKNDMSPNHENLIKLNSFLEKIVADQIFAIESRPDDKSN